MDQTQGGKLGSKAILLTNNSFFEVIVLFCILGSPPFPLKKRKKEQEDEEDDEVSGHEGKLHWHDQSVCSLQRCQGNKEKSH